MEGGGWNQDWTEGDIKLSQPWCTPGCALKLEKPFRAIPSWAKMTRPFYSIPSILGGGCPGKEYDFGQVVSSAKAAHC